MDAFNWLHLSDLHWGCPRQKGSWPEIRRRFIESLHNLHEKCGPWHAVFFTGDLVQKGQDFQQMEEQTLVPLWGEFRKLGSTPVLLAVPGNHDLERPSTDPPSPEVRVLMKPGQLREIAEEFWEDAKSPYRKVIDEAFAQYATWWSRRPFCDRQQIEEGLLPGDFSTTFTTDAGRHVGVVGLNTTFLQLAEGDYQGRLACDVRQLNSVCQSDAPSWAQQNDLCFLLTHHGPDWLDKASRESQYAEINPAGRFAIHLFGHMHEEAMRSMSSGGGSIMRHWQAASLFGLEHFQDKNGQASVRLLNGYGAGSVRFEEQTVQLRHWPQIATRDSTNGWRFIPDHQRCVLEEDGGTLERINLPSTNKRSGGARPPHGPAVALKVSRGTSPTPDANGKSTAEDVWSIAAAGSALWTSEPASGTTGMDEFKVRVARLVAACWHEYHSAAALRPTNPWWDEHFPVRVLQRLECLTLRTDPVMLSDPELSLLVAAPFVREAVLASAVRFATAFLPFSLEPAATPEEGRRILEQVQQGSPNLVRRARRLKKEGDETSHNAIAAWLMLRALHRAPESWLLPPRGFISPALQSAFREAAEGGSEVVREAFSLARLLELARCVHSDPERIERTDRSAALKRSVSLAPSTYDEREVRERLLGYLVCLAGWMAIDVRTLDCVLVEHIGLSDPIIPEHVVSLLRSSAWPLSGKRRVLRVACDHPAVDYALRDHVTRADSVLQRVHRKVDGKEDGLEVLSGLPTRFAADDITPSSLSSSEAPYQVPHLRFHLAHDEVRELLMGESLYGDPTAAIRELYQNALDACRYRTARIAYLARSQPNVTQSWRGRIIFRQGCDASGRPFIECEDNGVGMGRQELDECFARAGRRFVDLPGFIEEQLDWLACDPPIRLYPNAQFGIGVFSYLLLADELLVETCRFRRDGSLGQPMVARVSGSGGLFRVSEVVNANRGGAGTRVRLYLNRTNWKDQPISCAAKLSEILWAAQFETEVHEGGDVLHWSPEEFRHPRLKPQEYVNAGGQDVWWSSHDGRILVDGLAIGTSQYDFCVANLQGPRRPHLMMNRSAIMPHEGPMPEWDKSFVDENLLQGVDRLRTWPDLTVAWLWRVARGNWKLAEKLLDVLCLGDCDIRIGRGQRGDRTVSLRKLGCFDGDEVLLDVLMNVDVSHTPICTFGMLPEWLLPWRVALWESEGIPVPQQVWRALPKPAQGISSPRLVPGDSMVLSSSLGGRDWLAGKVPMSHLIRAAAKMQEPITAIMTRLERFAPFGVSLPDVRGLDLDRFSARADDIIALSKNSHEGGVCLDDRASAAHIIRVAAKLATPLDRVIARFQEYERLGIKLPPSIRNGSDISGIAVRREYLAMLAGDLNEGGISLDDRISPVHLVHIAGKTKRTVGEVLMDLTPFATIGLRLPEVTDATQLCFVPTDDDLLALSERLDRQAPISDDRISSSHIVRIAFKLNRPVATVVTDLRRFAPLGVLMPEVELSRVGNLTVTAEDARAMSQNRGTWGLSIGDRVPGVHIFLLSCELQEPLVNVLRRLSRFGCLGLQLPDVDLHKVDSIRKMGVDDLTALSQNCDGDWPWLDGVVTQEHVRRAATELYDSPDEIVERLRAFECLGLTVPSGDCETWDQ